MNEEIPYRVWSVMTNPTLSPDGWRWTGPTMGGRYTAEEVIERATRGEKMWAFAVCQEDFGGSLYTLANSEHTDSPPVVYVRASTGTAPQRPKADPKMVTCFQCRGDGTCFASDDPCPVCGGLGSITDDPVAPVPQTEGECPDCEGHGETNEGPDGVDDEGYPLYTFLPCPTCSGTGKEGEK